MSSLDFTFERLAVNPEQITAWSLPSRPTKKTDQRTRQFEERYGEGTESVELDAIEPNQLREIVREAIERHLPQEQMEVLREARTWATTPVSSWGGRLARAPPPVDWP
jgi:hypothetical protein